MVHGRLQVGIGQPLAGLYRGNGGDGLVHNGHRLLVFGQKDIDLLQLIITQFEPFLQGVELPFVGLGDFFQTFQVGDPFGNIGGIDGLGALDEGNDAQQIVDDAQMDLFRRPEEGAVGQFAGLESFQQHIPQPLIFPADCGKLLLSLIGILLGPKHGGAVLEVAGQGVEQPFPLPAILLGLLFQIPAGDGIASEEVIDDRGAGPDRQQSAHPEQEHRKIVEEGGKAAQCAQGGGIEDQGMQEALPADRLADRLAAESVQVGQVFVVRYCLCHFFNQALVGCAMLTAFVFSGAHGAPYEKCHFECTYELQLLPHQDELNPQQPLLVGARRLVVFCRQGLIAAEADGVEPGRLDAVAGV